MNDIKQSLVKNVELIESALSEYYTFDTVYSQELIDVQRYALLNGGKRIRAFLILQTCEILGGSRQAALPYACAMEMMHSSSLVHDDLPCMDNDDYRRGKPSAHKQFNEALALLAGDALMTSAFETIVNNPYLSASINSKAVQILASHSGSSGMLAGQAIDTEASLKRFDFQTLLKVHSLKTARLVCASVKLGCLAAGLDEQDERYSSLIEYAENVGLAFQILDDILDYEAGKRELNSFLSFMSLEEAKAHSKQLTQKAIDRIRSFDNGTLEDLANYLILRTK